jgi:Leucine-rich repeat (LRR) protein
LILKENQIVEVQQHAFDELTAMTILEMNNNKIETLPQNIFAKNIKLRKIIFDENQLKVISAELFINNLKLQALDFRNNSIDQIEENFHQNLISLKSADFSGNFCINEFIQVDFSSQWKQINFSFKECYRNFKIGKLLSNLNEISKQTAKLESSWKMNLLIVLVQICIVYAVEMMTLELQHKFPLKI